MSDNLWPRHDQFCRSAVSALAAEAGSRRKHLLMMRPSVPSVLIIMSLVVGALLVTPLPAGSLAESDGPRKEIRYGERTSHLDPTSKMRSAQRPHDSLLSSIRTTVAEQQTASEEQAGADAEHAGAAAGHRAALQPVADVDQPEAEQPARLLSPSEPAPLLAPAQVAASAAQAEAEVALAGALSGKPLRRGHWTHEERIRD